MVFLSYVRYEIFSMFDYLTLYNVFNHFKFCTKNCYINGFCFDCSRVNFPKDECIARCFSRIRYSEDFISHKLSQMLLHDGVFFFELDISLSKQKYFCAVQIKKNGCMFFDSCNNSSQVFTVFIEVMMRLYLNTVFEIYKNLFRFAVCDCAYNISKFDKVLTWCLNMHLI